MTYYLGIDLGTTYVGAALVRDGRAEIVTLGDRSAVVPSVLFFKDDGDVLTGESAIRRGLSDPSRVVREFKRRVGDTTPVMVGVTPYSADSLTAELLRRVLAEVNERQGEPPAGIALTHPANWGPYKVDVLHQAVRMADAGDVTILTEPEAAAIHYAATERLLAGEVVAVYDLGGGTFDAAVLRKTDGERPFELLGQVEGVERLGGIDFDEAIFQHAMRFTGPELDGLDPQDPATVQAVARLRQECVAAKEALSSDTDVSIPILLPSLQTEVRLTRSEFEAMIRPSINQTIEALRRALRSAAVEPEDLTTVLLVGGSSRIPLIAEMVGAELGRPIAVDVHPKHTVALGAALAAASTDLVAPVVAPADAAIAAAPPEPAPEVVDDTAPSEGVPVAVLATAGAADAAPTPPVPDDASTAFAAIDSPHKGSERSRPWFAIGGVAAAIVAAAVIGIAALSSSPAAGEASDATTTAPPVAAAGDSAVVMPDAAESTTSTTTSTTASPTTTLPAVTTTTLSPEDGLDVIIDAITVVDGAYHITYRTDFEPLIGSDPASHHIHFFFDTVPVTEAGVPGAGPWKLYDTPSPFTGWRVSDRPAAARQMCATVATNGHAVLDPMHVHCLDLPDD